MTFNNSLNHYDISVIDYDKEKGTLFNTKNEDIKIYVFGKKETIILSVIEEEKLINIDYDKYVLSNILDNTLLINGKKYRPISVLTQAEFNLGNYQTSDHIGMETLEEYRGLGLMNEMFKVKDKINGILNTSIEDTVSNIVVLLKNGYKVTGKVDNKTGEIIPFNGQAFVEKIIKIKLDNNKFLDKLSNVYVFEKK